MLISSDDDTDSTKLDGEYDLEGDSDVYIRMVDNVDAPGGVYLDGYVDIDRDSEDEVDEDEEDEKEEVLDEDEEENEDEDEDEDNGKQPRMISQGEMVHTSAYNADTMINN